MTFRVDPARLDLAAEFKANIYGRHSGDLQRILNAFRSEAQAGQYVLIREGRHGPWALAEYDPRPGQVPGNSGPSSKPRPRRNGPSSSCAGSGTPARPSSSTERAHHAADHRLCRPHGGPARRNHRIQGELRGRSNWVSRPDSCASSAATTGRRVRASRPCPWRLASMAITPAAVSQFAPAPASLYLPPPPSTGSKLTLGANIWPTTPEAEGRNF